MVKCRPIYTALSTHVAYVNFQNDFQQCRNFVTWVVFYKKHHEIGNVGENCGLYIHANTQKFRTA